jgi:hypothetical protein
MLTKLLTIVGLLLLVWVLYRGVKGNPQAFSRENLGKSFTTLGVLALGLIALVAAAVMFLKR